MDYCDSFWRHPFTAEDPLLSKWCNATFLQIWWRNKLIYILDGLKVSTKVFIFGWTNTTLFPNEVYSHSQNPFRLKKIAFLCAICISEQCCLRFTVFPWTSEYCDALWIIYLIQLYELQNKRQWQMNSCLCVDRRIQEWITVHAVCEIWINLSALKGSSYPGSVNWMLRNLSELWASIFQFHSNETPQ